MAVVDADVIVGGNDKESRFYITKTDAATGRDVPATGLTGMTVHYAATEGGGAIDASLSVNVTEIGNGWYVALHTGSAISTYIAGTYTTVWRILVSGSVIKSQKQVSVLATRLMSSLAR